MTPNSKTTCRETSNEAPVLAAKSLNATKFRTNRWLFQTLISKKSKEKITIPWKWNTSHWQKIITTLLSSRASNRLRARPNFSREERRIKSNRDRRLSYTIRVSVIRPVWSILAAMKIVVCSRLLRPLPTKEWIERYLLTLPWISAPRRPPSLVWWCQSGLKQLFQIVEISAMGRWTVTVASSRSISLSISMRQGEQRARAAASISTSARAIECWRRLMKAAPRTLIRANFLAL